MDQQVLSKLRELVHRHGREFCTDPHRCEQLLRQAMGDMPREVNLLLAAVRQGVAQEVLEYDDESTVLLLIDPLAQRLVDKLALTPSAAAWAVESWAIALRVVGRPALDAHRRDHTANGPKTSKRRLAVRTVVLLTLAAVLLYASSKWFRQVGLEHERAPVPRVFAPARLVVGNVRTFAPGESPLECLAVLPDGERVLTGQADGQLRIWHISTGRRLGDLSVGGRRPIVCLATSRDGRRALVAVGGPNHEILVVDLQRLEIVARLHGHAVETTAVAFAPDNRHAVSGCADGEICVWDVDTARLLKRLVGRRARLAGLAVSPDGQQVLSARADHTVQLWDVPTAKPIAEITAGTGPPPVVAFGRRGPTVMAVETVGGAHHRVHVWALTAGGRLERICRFYTRDTCAAAAGMGLSPQGDLAVFCETGGLVHLWDVSAASEVARFVAPARMVAFLPGRRWSVLTADESFLRLWALPANRVKLCLQADSERIAVAFARDGKTVFAWGPREAGVKAWSLPAGRVTIVSRKQMDPFIHPNPTISPDGRRLLPGNDGAVRLVDTAKDTEIVYLEGHLGSVYCAVFSSDFRYALSGGQDGTVRLWDLKTFQLAARFEGHDGPVTCLAFSPDARLAVSGGVDATVRIWSLPLGPDSHTQKDGP